MKRLLLSLAALALAGTGTALADDAATVFAKRCASCHGKDGKGTPIGQKMGAQDLTATKLSEPQVAEVVAGGRGKMSAYKGKLSDEEIKAVAKFVKSLK